MNRSDERFDSSSPASEIPLMSIERRVVRGMGIASIVIGLVFLTSALIGASRASIGGTGLFMLLLGLANVWTARSADWLGNR
jgi:uncharacterized membrane protein HdeD (DUF308 family)